MVASSSMSAARKSAISVIEASKSVRRATDATWALAPKCPMFQRKTDPKAPKRFRVDPRTGKKKEVAVVRTNRLISGHAYKIGASGAARAVSARLQNEAQRLRLEVGGESKKVPWLPSYSKGAIALIEQFLCAYGQEAFSNAVSVRVGLNTHKRVTPKMMKIGFERAHESVFGSSVPGARAVFVTPLPKKKASKKGDSKAVVEEEAEWNPEDGEEGAEVA